MNIHYNTKSLVESAIITAMTCVFGIAAMYIPFFAFFVFFIPLPLIILAKRRGIKFSVLSLIVSYVVLITFSDVATALFLVLFPGIPAIVIGILMKKEKSPYQILGFGIIAGILATGFSLFTAVQISGIPVHQTFSALFEQVIKMQQSLSKITGMPESALDQQIAAINKIKEMMISLIPALIIISAGLSVMVNYFLSAAILRKLGDAADRFPPFKYFSLPRNIFWGFLIIYILSYGAAYFELIDKTVLMTNIMYIFQFIFIIQGLAVVAYYFGIKKTAKWIQIIVFIFLLFSGIGGMALFILGITDSFINIRRMMPENQ